MLKIKLDPRAKCEEDTHRLKVARLEKDARAALDAYADARSKPTDTKEDL